MNFKELLDVADYNKVEAKHEASVKRYSSDLPPPKKNARSGVQSGSVAKFLARKKAEEEARLNEARKQRDQLLALRATSTKNNKKAKIMASRTKDNDFSRIRLTEDEIQSKKKIEIELQRKHLADKVERMKCRIEMEEKEKLLPKKRKRKSKHKDGEEANDDDSHFEEEHIHEEARNSMDGLKNRDKNSVRKPPRPPPPTMSFSELLKVAETKQHEPVVVPKKKKEEEKLLTKKGRRIYEQEQERLRRKQERLERGEMPTTLKSSNSTKHSPVVDQKNLQNAKANVKKPMVIHVERDTASRSAEESQRFKIPKGGASVTKTIPNSKIIDKSKLPSDKHIKGPFAPKSQTNHDREKSSKSLAQSEKSQMKPTVKEINKPVFKKPAVPDKSHQKKNGVKIAPVAAAPSKQVPNLSIDTEALTAAIEKRIREKIEKEMEAKFSKIAEDMKSSACAPPAAPKPVMNKPSERVKQPNIPNGSRVSINGKSVPKFPSNQPAISKRVPEKILPSKQGIPSRNSAPPPPVKRAFHPNPYLDPPRKRLEPIRRNKPPPKRRIESDEEDDDDDMSDFIDNGGSQNDEDYSKYIQEIFGYDRKRYIDEDDDDIVETSFVEQMKEETRSAKLGYLEDLEEERKLKEMEKKRKKKLKK